MRQACPKIYSTFFNSHKENEASLNNMALVCSNYLIWKHWLDVSANPHLVIFEDDTIITDPRIWNKLGIFMRRPCLPWEYLLVDAWSRQNYEVETVVDNETCPDMELNNLSYNWSGSHMQVFTRTMVQKLVAWYDDGMPLSVQDKVVRTMARMAPFPVDGFQVRAHLVTQARFTPELAMSICNGSVVTIEDRHAHLQATKDHGNYSWTC